MNTSQLRRTRTARSVLAVLPLAAVAAFAAPAHADQPQKETFTDVVNTQVATSICDFPVTITGQQTGFLITSADGTVIQGHAREQDTFTANGNTLTGLPYTFNATITLDPEGNELSFYTVGQIIVVPIDQGVTFRSAGRVDWATVQGDFVVTPSTGGSQNLDAFCAALAS